MERRRPAPVFFRHIIAVMRLQNVDLFPLDLSGKELKKALFLPNGLVSLRGTLCEPCGEKSSIICEALSKVKQLEP